MSHLLLPEEAPHLARIIYNGVIMPPIKNIPILPKPTSSLESTVTAQQDGLSSNITIAYTQNDNPTPSTSTNLPLPFRSIKKDFIFKEKYKTLLECLSKGKNPEINTLLVNHVREIDKLVRSHNVSFSSAHQQFILSLSNNIPEDLQDKDLNICINNINNLLNKILFFTQKLVEIRSSNINKIKQYVDTSTVIRPIWLFKEKKVINAKSLIDLSEEQIVQIANTPNIEKQPIYKKFIGKGFSTLLLMIEKNNSKNPNATTKRNSSTLESPPNITYKKIKLDKKPLNKTELASQNKLLLDNHFEKIKKFCKDQSISFGKCNIDFIGYFYSHYPKALFDDKGNYLLAKLLDKLYLIITELNKYNNVASTFFCIEPIFGGNNSRHLESILALPDEQIKDPSFNQSLFKLLTTYKNRSPHSGYPTVDEILANKT
jgi:hypothetical protein